MIDLRPDEHAALAALNRAGANGLTLREVRISYAIRLELCGLAKIHSGAPQRVTLTQKGRAHLQRRVWA